MKVLRTAFFCLAIFASFSDVCSQDRLWQWESGPYRPGFRLIEKLDYSRLSPLGEEGGKKPRTIRIYIWYPAENTVQIPMKLEDYARMARADFLEGKLPVPLTKGLSEDGLNALLEKLCSAVENAPVAAGSFPLLVLAQGLYYESPFSHVVLCEYLASFGYVVASCPLLGTDSRLVNLDVKDLETEIRDLEFVLGTVLEMPQYKTKGLGLIGYDLGGMAGLVLAMRNSGVEAFLSLDAGILFGHPSELPGIHPHYSEERFTIPWMHMTQGRFITAFRDQQGQPHLLERKLYGDSYLVHVETDNHGQFSSYAMFGIQRAVTAYWDSWAPVAGQNYRSICTYALAFLDAYLKQDGAKLESLRHSPEEPSSDTPGLSLEYKEGRKPPPSSSELIRLIIDKGVRETLPVIEEARKTFPGTSLIEEDVLNWLGYHFLYFWGRENEAVEVFELNSTLFPESANTYDSLGEAYFVRGDFESAIRCYRKSLELDPQNENARRQLELMLKRKKISSVDIPVADHPVQL